MAWVDWATQFGATTSSSDVTITSGQEIEVSGTVNVRTVTINAGGKLRRKVDASSTMNVYGHYVIRGLDERKPTSASVVMRTNMLGAVVANFMGTGGPGGSHDSHGFMASDVGTWILGAGVADWQGSPKTPYLVVNGAVAQGVTSIPCTTTPTGWLVGDNLAVTPMQPPTYTNHSTAYSYGNYVTTSSNNVVMGTPTAHAHLVLDSDYAPPAGWTGPTEVTARLLNFTRNVQIYGVEGAEPHILFQSTAIQTIKHVEVRYHGPVKTTAEGKETILGRYPLHFHLPGEPTGYGSGARHRVEGTVVRDCPNRAYVPHVVTGVQIVNTISHNIGFGAYWWDPDDKSQDILLDGVIASLTQGPSRPVQYRLAGITLASTNPENATCINSYVCGTQGGTNSSAYHWFEGDDGLWIFHDNIAVCNSRHGVLTWQNSALFHDVTDTICGWNGGSGIDHGAYQNSYLYDRMWLIGNGGPAVRLHSSSKAGRRQTFSNIVVDGQEITPRALLLSNPSLSQATATLMGDWFVRDLDPSETTGRLAKWGVSGGNNPNSIRIENWNHDVADPDEWFWFEDDVVPTQLLMIRDITGQVGMYDLRQKDQAGTLAPEWNAAKLVVTVDDFYETAPAGGLVADTSFAGLADAAAWPAPWLTSVKNSDAKAEVLDEKGLLLASSSSGQFARAVLMPEGEVAHYLEVAITGSVAVVEPDVGARLYIRARKVGGDYYALQKHLGLTGSTSGRVVRRSAFSDTTLINFNWESSAARSFDFRVVGEAGEAPTIQLQHWPTGDERPSGFFAEFVDETAPPELRQAGEVEITLSRTSGGPNSALFDTPLRVYDLSVVDEVIEPIVPEFTWDRAGAAFSVLEDGAAVDLALAFSLNDEITVDYTAFSDADWLVVDPADGTVSGVGPHAITLTADPTGLAAGTHTAELFIEGEGVIGDVLNVSLQVVASDSDTTPPGVYVSVNGEPWQIVALAVGGGGGDTLPEGTEGQILAVGAGGEPDFQSPAALGLLTTADGTSIQALITALTARVTTLETQLDGHSIRTNTQVEYDALTPDADTIYHIVD